MRKVMASFFKSAKSKVKNSFHGHSKSKASAKANVVHDGSDVSAWPSSSSNAGAKEVHSTPGSPLPRAFLGAETNAVADRNAFSEASINLAAFSSVEEFNYAAMRAQRNSEARSASHPGVNVYNSHTDKTYVHSPEQEARPGGGNATESVLGRMIHAFLPTPGSICCRVQLSMGFASLVF